MGQRNIPCSMIDLEMDQQGQGHLRPEPCILFGSITSFPQSNMHTILPGSGNTPNLDAHHLPEHHDSAIFYGMMQYHGVQHHHPVANLDLGVATASNFYNPYMTPSSGSRVFPVPLNNGSSDQLPSSSNHGVIGVSTDEYGRNSYFMDGVRGSSKRKNAEGIPRNFQYLNASASSSSSVTHLSARHIESGVAASFPLPQYRVNGTPSIMEVGSRRSVRNRSGAIGLDSVPAHNHNHLVQGNCMGHPFQPVGTPWLDQQLSCNGGDGGTLTWNQAPGLPYLHGSNVNGGSIETGNMGVHGYHEAASNRSSTNFVHPPPIHHRHHNLHHPPPPMQGVRGHSIDLHSQVAASSYRLATNNASRSTVNPSQDGVETGPRHSGPAPPTGLRIYRPHRREVVPEATARNRNLPYLRILPTDEVAILDIPGFYEVGNFIDHHRDMRLDIEDMSYEELLALGERIGNVNTGLSEETVLSCLKTRTYVSSATCINLEEAACVDQETDFCIICQVDYKNCEKIGTLDCGHEYHADCLKKWLLIKNVCPICKSSALTTERKDV